MWHRFKIDGPDEVRGKLLLWPAPDDRQLPYLNCWAGLGKAFVGFISLGLDLPHAYAYDVGKALEIISEEMLAKTWIPGADLAEAHEYIRCNLLGIWFGNRTPYLVSRAPELFEF